MSGPLKLEVLRQEIRAHVSRIVGRPITMPDGEDAVAAGVIKSMNLLDLITQLEDSYGVAVSQKDIHAGHFRSIEAMASFVAVRK